MRWFREITDKTIHHGAFHSAPDLIAAIEHHPERKQHQSQAVPIDRHNRIHPQENGSRPRHPQTNHQLNKRHYTDPKMAGTNFHVRATSAPPDRKTERKIDVSGRESGRARVRHPRAVVCQGLVVRTLLICWARRSAAGRRSPIAMMMWWLARWSWTVHALSGLRPRLLAEPMVTSATAGGVLWR